MGIILGAIIVFLIGIGSAAGGEDGQSATVASSTTAGVKTVATVAPTTTAAPTTTVAPATTTITLPSTTSPPATESTQTTKAKAAASTTKAAPTTVAPQSGGGGPTVYITKTGEKYHRDGCRYLKQSKIAISLGEAKAQGYGACKVCKP